MSTPINEPATMSHACWYVIVKGEVFHLTKPELSSILDKSPAEVPDEGLELIEDASVRWSRTKERRPDSVTGRIKNPLKVVRNLIGV